MNLKDNLLESIVATVNSNPTFTLNITLYFQGVVLCGTLISYPEYLRLTSSTLNKFDATDLANTFEQLADEYAMDIENAKNDLSISSINLKDVIVISENNLEVPVWSGKFDSIDGYNLGGIKISK